MGLLPQRASEPESETEASLQRKKSLTRGVEPRADKDESWNGFRLRVFCPTFSTSNSIFPFSFYRRPMGKGPFCSPLLPLSSI